MTESHRAQRGVRRIHRVLLFGVGLLVIGGIVGCDLILGGLVPGVPTELTATDGAFADRVRLTWNPVPEAGGYEIWRAPSADGEFRYVGATAHASFDDMQVVPGTMYWYKVRACNRAGCGEFSEIRSGRALSPDVPLVPTRIAASQGTFVDHIRVTWQPSARATSYHVYRATAPAAVFSLVATVSGVVFEDQDVVVGATYWYKLRACSAAGCSLLSAAVSGYAAIQVLPPPQGVTATDGTEAGKVVVTWEETVGATSYLVYRADAEDGAPTLLGSVPAPRFEDTTAQIGTTYWYRVRACNAAGCSPLSSADSGSAGGNGEQPPPPPPAS